MILTFHVPPLDRGQELFEIDSLLSRKIHKDIKKLESPGLAKLNFDR